MYNEIKTTMLRSQGDTKRPMTILVIETSTTSAKAMILNSIDASTEIVTELLLTTTTDPTTHDAKEVFLQTMALAKKLCARKIIDMIALVTTWHSLTLCDKNYTPVSPTYLWLSKLADNLCHRLNNNKSYVDTFYQTTGCIVSSAYPFFKYQALLASHFQDFLKHSPLLINEPTFNTMIKPESLLLLDQGSYMMHRLTGQAVVLNSLASGTGFYNVVKGDYDENLLAQLNLLPSQLPRVVSSDETFPLTNDGATLLGLPSGTPVIAPGPDGAFNQLGSAFYQKDDTVSIEGIMTLSVGTSGALRQFSWQPRLSQNQSTWCYALESGWLVGAATSGACNCVDFMKATLFDTQTSYSDIETQLTQFTPPLDAPLFMPFIFGERSPGWNNSRPSGLFFESDTHKMLQVNNSILCYYTVLEGVLFNLYQCYLELIQLTDTPHTIKLSGGILHSPFWTQLCADIFGKVLEVDSVQHASLMGGVYLATQQNATASLDAKMEDATSTKKSEPDRSALCFNPRMMMHDFYQQRFQKYLEVYHMTS